MKRIKGDLVEMAKNGDFDVIVHGCNCFNNMGAGIALTIKNAFPSADQADQATIRGDKNKVGTYTVGKAKNKHGGDIHIINAYTQYHISRGGDVFEYEGFIKILNKLVEEYPEKRIGFPLIGCGLAKGDEKRIIGLIDAHLHPNQEVTIVEFSKSV